ncbi:alpha/beta fold hydrolase [Glacieibacterium megasporae]|uniref:alpha/beta fold hydrolase n=1 Tax=Glacieibacterium megasporae TaxID=2835787 RepID=UPI001C1E66E1|nr:alpha/beta fold hydrolase [Polymorphobacter megasporae]UAJ10304.1 alpha/beta hydrolase [Polymorphobacter megasporae]
MSNDPTKTAVPAQTFASFDGQAIVWREVGEGRPVVLLHGLFSDAVTNWIRFGTAATIAAAGFRVIMPDFRGHGLSAKPHDAAAYPVDVLSRDVEALVAHLGLTDFDLGGYSLGSRTAVRLMVRGMRPRRVVLAGMGLAGLIESNRRTGWFLNVIAEPDSFARGTPGWLAVQFMKTNKIDGEAVSHLLRAQAETSIDAIRALATPALVVCGAADQDNGSAPDLAAALPNAHYNEIPGTHMSSVTMPNLGAAIAAFVAQESPA